MGPLEKTSITGGSKGLPVFFAERTGFANLATQVTGSGVRA